MGADSLLMPESSSIMSVWILRLTSGILGLWLFAALFETVTGHPLVLVSYRAFGLISPLVGFIGLMLSLAAFGQARRTGASTWQALGAALVSVVIGVAPFIALPYDPS
jgi:hypothetical protein